jgi:phenylpropionate dioxygenase-like ring-hydroxylating dioxygenase large terminal subunit
MDRTVGFTKADVCLTQFAVDEWHGFVLVNIGGNATAFCDGVPALDALFAEKCIGECVSVGQLKYLPPWNGKISVESFVGSHHHRGIHAGTRRTNASSSAIHGGAQRGRAVVSARPCERHRGR